MKNRRIINVEDPKQFINKLQEVMPGIQDLFELTKEQDLSALSEDGVQRYSK